MPYVNMPTWPATCETPNSAAIPEIVVEYAEVDKPINIVIMQSKLVFNREHRNVSSAKRVDLASMAHNQPFAGFAPVKGILRVPLLKVQDQ